VVQCPTLPGAGRPRVVGDMRPTGAILICVAMAILVIGIASCAQPPDQAARKAKVSLGQLKDASRGQIWAADEFAAAEAAVQAADREMASQKARTFLTRDFAKAAQLYAAAQEDITLALNAAEEGKLAAERQAREALDAALAAIGHAQAALTVAPVSRDSRGADIMLERELDRMDSRLDEVRNLIVAEKYDEAISRAEEVLEQVTSLLRNVSRGARR